MASSKEGWSPRGSGVIGAGSAALRKMMERPLKGRKSDQEAGAFAFNSVLNSAVGEDPINAVIEGDIIPRLMMAHSLADFDEAPSFAESRSGSAGDQISAAAMQAFADLPLELEAANLTEVVDLYLAQGVSVTSVYLDLLAPAARRLGELWESDACDFVDVTMGLWRLQEVMRDIASRFPPEMRFGAAARRALFAPVPGDDHNFGALMIEEIFARAGWQSEVLPRPKRRELLDIVSRKPLDLVGLTVSKDCPSSSLSSLIKAVRSVAINPQMVVLIGGNTIVQNPHLVAEIGADGTGKDARGALELAERLVDQTAQHAQAFS